MTQQLWEIAGEEPATWRFNPTVFGSADAAEPVFVIGESDPATDWPRTHPTPLNAHTDYRTLRATVRFEADADADGRAHVLRLEAREQSGPSPDLRLSVNGVEALVLTRPVREDRAHAPMPPTPASGLIDRSIHLRPGLVRRGSNEIVFTPVMEGEPDPSELTHNVRPDLGSWFGSTMQWLRISLSTTTDTPTPELDAALTPFYVERDGGLVELGEAVVLGAADLAGVTLSVEGDGVQASINADDEGLSFGDLRLQFEAPDADDERDFTVTAAGSTRTFTLRPARKWTVHVVPHVHLDIGYTDRQPKVIEVHNRNLDKSLAAMEADPGWAFSLDGSFILQQYRRSRRSGRVDQVLEALREGRLSVNAFWALLLSGISGLEDLYHGLNLSAAMRREHGVPTAYANLTDVPSYSWAVPSVLSAAGIDGFFGIANHTRGGSADSDELQLLSPFVWEGPDGSSVLSFFADCYTQLRFIFADPPTLVGTARGLRSLLRRWDRDDYLPTDFPIVGTHSDNEDLSDGYAGYVDRWNAAYAWPKLKFSTFADYLDTVRPLRDQLPVVRGDGGSYWEDGVGTQAAATATTRSTQTLLPAVEGLAALLASQSDGMKVDLDALDEAWDDVLIGSEHTWTAAHATAHPHSHEMHDQLDWKVSRIRRGNRTAGDEGRRLLSQLAEQIDTELPGLLVYNAASVERDLWVEVELPVGQVLTEPDGEPVEVEPLAAARDGLALWRARVKGVPAFGYRMLRQRVSDDTDPGGLPGTTLVRSVTIEAPSTPIPAMLTTPHYDVALDPASGGLLGLTHLATGRQLVDQDSPWEMGEVIYAPGGGSAEHRGQGPEINSLYDYDPELPAARIRPTASITDEATLDRTPWGWTLTTTGSAPSIRGLTRRIRFYDDSDHIDVEVSFEKDSVLAKESVYVAFPFSGAPRIRYDRQTGWVDAAVDHQVGACNEWLTTQYSVVAGADDEAIAWTSADIPLFAVGDVIRGTWATSFEPSNATVFSWVMNNYWFTNTPAHQHGPITARYRFAPVDGLAEAARLGRELRIPAVASDLRYIERLDRDPRPRPAAGQLLAVEADENVAVTLLTPRTDGVLLARVQELSGGTGRATLPLPDGATSAVLTNAVEDDVSDLATDGGEAVIEVGPHEVKTIVFR